MRINIMFLKIKYCLALLVLGVILGSIGSAYDSKLGFAQNSSGNAPYLSNMESRSTIHIIITDTFQTGLEVNWQVSNPMLCLWLLGKLTN